MVKDHSKREPSSAELETATLTAFQNFHQSLRNAIPVVTVLGMALMIGANTVTIQSFRLSRGQAALVSIISMLAIYLASQRALVVLIRLVYRLRNTDPQRFCQIRFRIISDSSFTNPFLSARATDDFQESSYSDHVGLIVIHLPMVLLLVTSGWLMGIEHRNLDNIMGTFEHIQMQRTINPEYQPDPSTLERLDPLIRETSILGLYRSFEGLFLILYAIFLFGIATAFRALDLDEMAKRKIILCTPFVIVLLVYLVRSLFYDWQDNLRLLRFFWRVVF